MSDPAEVSWCHYQAMLFIVTAKDRQKPTPTAKLVIQQEQQKDEPVHSYNKPTPEKRSRRTISVSNERIDERRSIGTERSRRTINESNERIEEGQYVALDSVQAAIAKLNENDSYQTFGNYVAAELRKLPRRQANYIQRKLNRTLLDLLDANDSESPYPSEEGSLPASF